MHPAEFKEWRRRLGLTQEKAAELIGTSRVTIGNWESGDTPIWVSVERVCRDVEHHFKMQPEYGPVRLRYCIRPIGKPVTGPIYEATIHERILPNNEAALREISERWGTLGFHDPIICDEEDGDALWIGNILAEEIGRRLAQKSTAPGKSGLAERLMEIGRDFSSLPPGPDPDFTADDLYDEDGLPK